MITCSPIFRVRTNITHLRVEVVLGALFVPLLDKCENDLVY
jgi:hypothetical protein